MISLPRDMGGLGINNLKNTNFVSLCFGGTSPKNNLYGEHLLLSNIIRGSMVKYLLKAIIAAVLMSLGNLLLKVLSGS